MAKAVRYHCVACCCYDGKMDCEIVTCPLYYWQPYRKLKPDLSWEALLQHEWRKKGAYIISPDASPENKDQ